MLGGPPLGHWPPAAPIQRNPAASGPHRCGCWAWRAALLSARLRQGLDLAHAGQVISPLCASIFLSAPMSRGKSWTPLSPHRCSLCGGQAGAGREPPWRLRAFAWRKTAERARKRPLGSPPLLLVSLGRGAVIKFSLREPSPTIGPLGGNPRVLIQLGCSASGCKCLSSH